MSKRFLVTWVVVFIAWMAGSFVVHGIPLNSAHAQLPNLFRPQDEAAQYSHRMLLAHAIKAGAFVWIYQRGAETKA